MAEENHQLLIGGFSHYSSINEIWIIGHYIDCERGGIMDLSTIIHQLRVQEWAAVNASWKQELFSPKWWALLGIVIISYVVWWRVADKSRLAHLLLFGSFVTIMRIIFDDLVVGMGLYSYKVRLVPLVHALIVNDLTTVALFYMIVYQFASTWKSFIIWSAVWSGLWAFVIKPLFTTFGILILYDWNYFYTFIALFLIGVLSRFSLLLVLRVEKGNHILHSIDNEMEAMLQPAMKPLHRDEQDDGTNK